MIKLVKSAVVQFPGSKWLGKGTYLCWIQHRDSTVNFARSLWYLSMQFVVTDGQGKMIKMVIRALLLLASCIVCA